MSLPKIDIKSTREDDISDTKKVTKALNIEDDRDIGRVNISSSNTEITCEDDIGETKRKTYSFKTDIISYITKFENFLHDSFVIYQKDFMDRFNSLKNEYKHIEEKELAYWFFCAEAQKRAYLYKDYKEKIDLQIKSFSDSQKEINTPKNKNYQLEIANLLKHHRKDYTALAMAYYDKLVKNVIELNFSAKGIELIVESNIQYEFLVTDDTMHWLDSENTFLSWELPQEFMQYNLQNAEELIALYKVSVDEDEKAKLLSALDQNGIIYRRDFSTTKPKSNAHIQPLQIYNDNVFVGIDFTLSDRELIKYIKKLKKEFLSLPAFSRIKPSEQLKLAALEVDLKKEKLMMSNLLPDHSNHKQFLEILFLYDAELFGCKKNDAENNLPDVDDDGIIKPCLNSQTRKRYRNIISIMTSHWYLEQCAKLKK
jgi:hypothetical protein